MKQVIREKPPTILLTQLFSIFQNAQKRSIRLRRLIFTQEKKSACHHDERKKTKAPNHHSSFFLHVIPATFVLSDNILIILCSDSDLFFIAEAIS
ncbi:CDG_1a_G0027030.mRNA.1.CDS.1 [Saccharomyces cerevisiae]|nr:BLD_1a_G0026920.mRNA.1.CDS.1 [Saccharomyces cerevisiae]CAI4402703.1 CDG_1a_G0027030.mRNA.1.CDS.1 [Saccharomyces cerevisiae]CAI4407423.1 BBL_G0026740.mRNA.1.CDS.1 [Saccharomyces cerevisiae]CAI4407612.1 CCT_1a_G0027480.mRNA.1.CDS.1 [Saccharomyces cerevisiae]CAI7092277.1 BLD_1a_G0026920.mRNA.1.CDS.1 [Saccharomyces cerevisiae]